MRALTWIPLLTLGFAACAFLVKSKSAGETAATAEEAPEWQRPAVPPEVQALHLAERFPGARQLDLAKLVWWPEPRTGACWSELLPFDETTVEADYTLAGESGRHRHSAPKTFTEAGWTKVYRAPQGEGVERRAAFQSLELSLMTEIRCRCAPGNVVKEGERAPVKLRFRWAAGKVPEVSGRRGESGRTTGLTPILTFGKLVTYDFPVKARFPDHTPGTCGAHVTLTVLVEPPML